jgi:type IV pilus assembly protein PilE
MKLTHPAQGFTLIDVLVTVACVAVLATFAWPSYQSLVWRGQRAQARTALLQAAHWFERAASANGSYPASNDIPASVLQVEGQRYQMTATSASHSYTLSATPVGTQSGDACGSLTLNHLGVRGMQGGSQTAAQCWGR